MSAPTTPTPPAPSPQPTGEYVGAIVADASGLVAWVTTGIVRSTDGGASWSVPNPIRVLHFSAIGSHLLAATSNGVIRSGDGGLTWITEAPSLQTDYSARFSIAVDGTTVLATIAYQEFGVSRSTDLGAHWEPANSGLPADVTVAAIAASDGAVFAIDDADRLYRTVDGGASWSELGVAPGTGSVAFAAGGGRVYLGRGRREVYVSSDAGASWSQTEVALPPGTVLYKLIPRGTDLYALTRHGLYRTSDVGASWLALPVGAVVWDLTEHAGALFAATETHGVQRSDDNGATWTRLKATGGGPAPWVFN